MYPIFRIMLLETHLFSPQQGSHFCLLHVKRLIVANEGNIMLVGVGVSDHVIDSLWSSVVWTSDQFS